MRLLSLFIALLAALPLRAQLSDKDLLARALDYFQSQKYHEALLIFEPLDQKYELNARYRAYMGLCYYEEWKYDKATEYLDSVMADIVVYSPQERTTYYYADAESHFLQGRYSSAIPLYKMALLVCSNIEQGEQHFKLALCHLQLEQLQDALNQLKEAKECYEKFPVPDSKARLAQIGHMIGGIKKQLE